MTKTMEWMEMNVSLLHTTVLSHLLSSPLTFYSAKLHNTKENSKFPDWLPNVKHPAGENYHVRKGYIYFHSSQVNSSHLSVIYCCAASPRIAHTKLCRTDDCIGVAFTLPSVYRAFCSSCIRDEKHLFVKFCEHEEDLRRFASDFYYSIEWCHVYMLCILVKIYLFFFFLK